MAGIFNIIAKLFGNKYDKDIKQIRPIVDKIHLEHKKISQLSHDELRNQTKILKSKIRTPPTARFGDDVRSNRVIAPKRASVSELGGTFLHK